MKTDIKLARAKIDLEGTDDGHPGSAASGVYALALQPSVDNRARWRRMETLGGRWEVVMYEGEPMVYNGDWMYYWVEG